MKSTVIISLVVLAVIGGLVYSSMSKKSSDSTMESTKQEATVKEDSAMMAENAITIDGSHFKFNPDKLTVKKGAVVKIVLKNSDASDEFEIKHDFVIDELKVQSDEIGEGETTTFEFTADQVGTFEYYCSIGEHRANGMFGTLTVEE